MVSGVSLMGLCFDRAFVRDLKSGAWLRCNDTRVSLETEAEVQKVSIGGVDTSSSAYFLIFVSEHFLEEAKGLPEITRDKRTV